MEGLALFDYADAQRTPPTLEELERVIESGLQTFVEVGLALLDIRDRRLYRQSHATFEDYCRQRWEMGQSRAYQMMDAARVAQTIQSSTVVELPASERQARELTPLLRAEPAAIAPAWEEARRIAAEAEREVTAADVREAVERRITKPQAEAAAERRAAIAERVQVQVAEHEEAAVLPFGAIVQRDALTYLRALPDACAHLCITSPPYWAKRTYDAGEEEIGREDRPLEYLAAIRRIVAEIGRVLDPAGWLLLNVGDTLANQPGRYRGDPERARGISTKVRDAASGAMDNRQWDVPDKSLCLIPWRLLTDLVLEDGWRCRNIIAWHKLGHQPENVFDRLTQAWEPVFALTRSEYPYYDRNWPVDDRPVDVWSIPVGRNGDGGKHPAVFPEKLVERAIHLACPPGGVVLDPFAGSGTVLHVAQEMGRKFLGCDLVDWSAQ